MITLYTNAEQKADQSRDLPTFRNFSLPGVRDEVRKMLEMIGRVETIFSTYTEHNISHVDSILHMLDWLIPPTTQQAMTPIDWLMIVLAIYLHDLGMVVSSEEYDKRKENDNFCQFFEDIQTRPENKDYLARAEKLAPENRERFFYQEFIRKEHASRIKEWITGRHSHQWGDRVKPIADAVTEMLKPLPPRFREHLGLICESHHRDDNLDKRDYFPLAQRYGSHPNEIANVQYAALLLRTADLLHVTWDRTPSVMYKIIGLSDPLGIDEWAKQKDTFSVYMKSRYFDPKDPASHIILVSANFVEERPYFALSEYLVYADQQIKQTKRLADVSQTTNDGKDYNFPWEEVKGDIQMEGHEPFPMNFELDRGRLLDLLVGHTIYNEPTVAVRELLQNAIDAVRYQHHIEKKSAAMAGLPEPTMGKVNVTWDPRTQQLIVQDNGIGMDFDVIKYHLMRVGSSFYNTPKFQSEQGDFTPISRFGIGILTCFMVSDDIEIVTCRNEGGYRIRMTSVHGDYLLKKLEPGNKILEGIGPHGTRVTLQFRSTVGFKGKSMFDILRYWIILPACKVFYHEPGKDCLRIGFDSPLEALRYFDSDIISQERTNDTEYNIKHDIEILQASKKENGETYELCFAVEKGFTPERNFLRREYIEGPAVCIEGIRVGNNLPGFHYNASRAFASRIYDESNRLSTLCAILSVNGNKRFQTTVSRSNLEQDDEYLRVGIICTNLLFEHVKKEVDRISTESTRPLSRASTAGQWVHRRLRQHIGNNKIRDYLDSLYLKLPLVVFETLDKIDIEVRTSRNLISLEQLGDLDSFWTIESRLVDYLGDISRDLGRELGLNDFLSKIAPDLQNFNINPIVADPLEFRGDILATHTVTKVEFSRKNQQTLVQWKNKKNVPNRTLNNFSILEKYMKIYEKETNSSTFNQLSPEERDNMARNACHGAITVPVTGDLKNIIIIETRLIQVYSLYSEPGRTFKILGDFLVLLSDDELDNHYYHALDILVIIQYLFKYSGEFRNRGPYGLKKQYSIVKSIWTSAVIKINPLLKELGLNEELPLEIPNVLLSPESTRFNASSYWMKWRSDDEDRRKNRW